jgi:ABC transporter substrate binding protein
MARARKSRTRKDLVRKDLNQVVVCFTEGRAALAEARGLIDEGYRILLRVRRKVETPEEKAVMTIYGGREFVEAGGLMFYGPNFPDIYRRAATYVDEIFKGAKPAELPVEQPTKFELVISGRAAKALGLEVPPSLLVRADEVIE